MRGLAALGLWELNAGCCRRRDSASLPDHHPRGPGLSPPFERRERWATRFKCLPTSLRVAPSAYPTCAAISSRLSTSFFWRPFLCAVYDVCDFHKIFEDSVNHQEGKRWQGKFTGPFYAARSTLVLERTSTNQHCRRLSWQGVERQP